MNRFRIWALLADRATFLLEVDALCVETAVSWARLCGARGAIHAIEVRS